MALTLSENFQGEAIDFSNTDEYPTNNAENIIIIMRNSSFAHYIPIIGVYDTTKINRADFFSFLLFFFSRKKAVKAGCTEEKICLWKKRSQIENSQEITGILYTKKPPANDGPLRQIDVTLRKRTTLTRIFLC
jgi:hypothetical protein